jgi:transcriptional regulator NrdR family protein
MGAVICKCGSDSAVIDSRPHKNSIRRRRKCMACGARWSTLEVRGTFDVDKPTIMRAAKARKRVEAQERQYAAKGEDQKETGRVSQPAQGTRQSA